MTEDRTKPLHRIANREDIPHVVEQAFKNGMGLMDLVFLDQWIRQHPASRDSVLAPAGPDSALFISLSPAMDPVTANTE